MQRIFRGEVMFIGRWLDPSPKFASLRYANCRPSLKGRVERTP